MTVSRILQLLLPKLCYCVSQKIVRFQNGSNKVAIELRVVQFGSEILLEITRMILDQIALHSVQLPFYIFTRENNKLLPQVFRLPLL